MTYSPVAGSRAPEVQVREPAVAPAVAPFGGEDDEIERVRALDLEPARAAVARFVGRIERLRHHAFVAARERVVVERLRLRRPTSVTMRGISKRRPARASTSAAIALARRPVGER